MQRTQLNSYDGTTALGAALFMARQSWAVTAIHGWLSDESIDRMDWYTKLACWWILFARIWQRGGAARVLTDIADATAEDRARRGQ